MTKQPEPPSKQGDSSAGLGSCLDLSDKDYWLYSRSMAGGWMVKLASPGKRQTSERAGAYA